MRNSVLTLIALVSTLTTPAPAAAQSAAARAATAPETFNVTAQGKAGAVATAANFQIRMDRYSADDDRAVVENALKFGGYPSFLPALRNAPAVGAVIAGTEKVAIRWARETPTPKGRTITLVTDAPLFFLGAGQPGAKPKAGYEVAVLQLQMDSAGIGTGTMAAAARVRPGGESGVQIDDYADEPIKLTSVLRVVE